ILDPSTLTINTRDTIALQTIQYFDGLGRPVQTVQKGINPRGYDIIKPVKYNDFGLDTLNYEPYVDSTHAAEYRPGFEADQPAFYNALFGDGNGMSPVTYEKSPLNRVMKQGAPGAPWQTGATCHPVRFDYLTNNTSDLKAVLWKVSGNTCTYNNFYEQNQLYVTKTISEDTAITFEFKDKQGQVVLKRSVLNAATNADTYYVYDDFGLLRFVLSPEGSAQITTSFDTTNILAKRYVYAYNYDSRNRIIAKRIPGKEPEFYVYDKTDKVVLYQDGNMRKYSGSTKAFEWMFTKYDALGRVIMTGITTQFPSQTRDAVQTLADGATYKCREFISYSGTTRPSDNIYYSNQAFPAYSSTNCTLLTLNYYDSYNVYLSGSATPVAILSNSGLTLTLPATPDYQPELKYVSGKPTANFIRYNNYMLQSATYYDVYGRVIQTCEQNQQGSMGYDRFTNLYKALTPNILKKEHTHFSYLSTPYPTLGDVTEYTYDASGRPLTYSYTYKFSYPYPGTSSARKIAYTYNTLGQVKTKQVKDDANLMQTVDYAYNIRGWLTKINDPATVSTTGDLFGMELFYNNTDGSVANKALFNGNISGIKWQTV
ncbi:MAG: hypothetical protein HXX20_24715, partial [Chloroflexi bacterium]|nr:hypothetical protein [Chloroflexota bacterium]